MVRRWWMVALLCSGCGGSGKDDGTGAQPPEVPEAVRVADAKLTAQVRDKLDTCGLRAKVDGEEKVQSLIHDDYDRCVGRCSVASACDDLQEKTCDDSKENAFASCLAMCPLKPADGYRCKSGARIPHIAVCDGEEDCRQGEDESDCDLTCANGTPLASPDLLCDQHRDCADGSDEVDCFVCPDTQN